MDPNAASELIQATVALAAVARLIYLNFVKQFPALLAFLAFLAAIDFRFGFEDQTSSTYFWSYIVLEPVYCLFAILAVRELLALTFREYPGIRTAGRWAMYAGIVFSLSISLVLTYFFWSGSAAGRAHSPYLYYVELIKRCVFFTLALVIVTLLVFLSRYPLHLSRNTLVSSFFFSALFLSETARLLVDSMVTLLHNPAVDWAQSGFIFICLFGWTLMLKRESRTTPPQIRFPSPREEHLLQQLNSLNQLMARASRR
jgi:hypothetical protein